MSNIHIGKVNGAGEYGRPRRPNSDTVTYLRSLPIDIHTFLAEVEDMKANEKKEAPPTFVVSLAAISEIREEIASLATEETSAEIIEAMSRIVGPYSEKAVKILLQGVSGYALFLSTHRYGSHVLQTVLEVASEAIPSDGFEADDGPLGNPDLPDLSKLVLDIVEEILPAASDLSLHICGSHVLRTLACSLGGVKIVSDKRSERLGRRGKKKKKKGGAVQHEGGRIRHRITYCDSHLNWKDENVSDSLNRLVAAVSGNEVLEPGQLQELSVHPSASPLLGIFLQVLVLRNSRSTWEKPLRQLEEESLNRRMDFHLVATWPTPCIERGDSSYALLCRLLCWKPEEREQKWARDVIYGLSGEPQGSHLLEVMLQLSNDDMLESILQTGGFFEESSLKEYIQHDVSNYVVQAILASIHSENLADKMASSLFPFVTNGYILKSSNRRRGILWRLVEMAARNPTIQQSTLKAMRDGFAEIGVSKSKSNGLVPCIPDLLSIIEPSDETGGRLVLDVAGTRSLFYMLRFESKFCEEALLGISKLSDEQLVLLAKDGLGSRCIWDGVLEGPVKESHFTTALKRILKELSGRWVQLAADRVGHHSVQKIFRRLVDISDKEKLVQELSESMHRLSGNNMGRVVLETCAVREYGEMGYSEWSKLIRHRAEKERWLKTIPLPLTTSEESTSSKPKRRRDRKRKRGSASSGNDE